MTDRPPSAMIFAAGFGNRMGEITQTMPKPMVPFLGRPMIDAAIDLVRAAGITDIVSNTHHLPDVIEPHLQSRGVTIQRESPDILDTGGGLKAALPALGTNPVITLNPDAAWLGANPVSKLLQAWQPTMQALLLLVPAQMCGKTDEQGDFSLEHGQIRRKGAFIYTGAQILRTEKLADIEDTVFSLNRYWDHLIASGGVHGIVYSGQWRDIGTPEGLVAAEQMVLGNDV